MITVKGKQRMVRQTTAPFEYENDKGETITDQIVVRYYVQTAKEAKERHLAGVAAYNNAKKNDEIVPFEYHIDTLASRLESLPDLAGPDGKAFAITSDNLGLLSVPNINAIHKAIEDDTNPKEQPSKSQNGLSSAKEA